MNELLPEHFEEFFREVYGFDPFPWQSRLARRVVAARRGESGWPEVLALPTAAGKTACIDIAVFALACQAEWETRDRTAPRRIFFVVDRRVIVDATYRRAAHLAAVLQRAQNGVVGKVADRLRFLGGAYAPEGDIIPLDVFRMRGGTYRDDRWVRSPLQPAVIVSTVDQFGSRLLFRGYGPSSNMWPVHAGLAANDSLVVLDEAHCANPFRQTMEHVARYRLWADGAGDLSSLPHRTVLLSATPPAGVSDTLAVDDDDRRHDILGGRIGCAKLARLIPVRVPASADGSVRWALRLAQEAVDLAGDQPRAVGVMVNRVATARAVHRALADMGHDVVLLTGRMRSIDQDRVIGRLEGLSTGEERELARSRFVVATQTLEVGADLDFDGLVTECASLDALRQRFGRLNRGGRAIEARATVMIQSGQLTSRGRVGPVYGETLARTWEWLIEHARDGVVNFGYEAFDRLMPFDQDERRELLRHLSAPAPDAPVMLPSHVDAWVQTAPTPAPDPDVSVFLHGPDLRAPDVQVCWRSDLPDDLSLDIDVELAIGVLSLCPPVSAECISVPIPNLRRWLRGEDGAQGLSDLGGEAGDAPGRSERHGMRRQVMCWRGPQDSRAVGPDGSLRPGDTVVIPTSLGGWDVFGHIPDPEGGGAPAIDVGDEAHLRSRAIPLLRIHEHNLGHWPECQARDDLIDRARSGRVPENDEEVGEVADMLGNVMAAEGVPEWLRTAAAGWRGDLKRKVLEHPTGGFVLQGVRRLAEVQSEIGTLTDEDDAYSATVEVLLDKHLDGVACWASHFSSGIGVSERLRDDLVLAARCHDLGKADHRMQAMFHGGSAWAAAASDTLLAKSAQWPTGLRQFRRAREAAGYPMGFRHELVSVRLMESVPELLDAAGDRDLVLHLVASHHGHGRPFAPVVDDPDPEDVEVCVFGHAMSASSRTELERLDGGVPERFWKLVRRYGWWGLALLEALVRVADHRCSEQERLER